MTNRRILLVDDEPHVLRALERQLGEIYDVTVAIGPIEGLATIANSPPFSVVVADMRMPGMDGVQFLSKVTELSPSSIRMMLTGNSDQTTAVQAVNEGRVFRFLNKPADPDSLQRAINDSLEQHRLLEAEKELLEKTLGGCIRVLVDILATVNPTSFGKAQLLKGQAAKVAEQMRIPDAWQIEMSAMLCHVGAVALPPGLGHKERTSMRLPEFEAGLMDRLPIIGSSLISKIPRLETVAATVLYQDQRFDGSGVPGDGRKGQDLPIGARVLKVLKDFNSLVESGQPAGAALNTMRGRTGWYDHEVLNVARLLLNVGQAEPVGVLTTVGELKVGDTLSSDLVTTDGILLAGQGQTITEAALARITAYLGLRLLGRKDQAFILEPVSEAA